MHNYCQSKIEKIAFFYIPKREMEEIERPLMELRFEGGKTVPGTQSYHQFYALDKNTIAYKRLSLDNFQTGSFEFNTKYETEVNVDLLVVGVYVAVVYDLDWYVGLIFMHGTELYASQTANRQCVLATIKWQVFGAIL